MAAARARDRPHTFAWSPGEPRTQRKPPPRRTRGRLCCTATSGSIHSSRVTRSRFGMTRPDQDPHEPPSLSWPAWAPALAASLLIIAIGGMTTWLALKFDALRPRVGDMIVFVPAQGDGDSW